MDGNYTDTITVASPDPKLATLPECRNVPGDGRFDQSAIPGKTILPLGRVDFADLPAFAPQTETDLLRQYLDKDHNWRHKAYTLQERFLIRDHMGGGRGIAGAAVAWANGTPLVGPDHITDAANTTTFPQLLEKDDYIWASAFAGSGRTNIGGIVTTEQLTRTDLHAAFYLAFGSYFVDWACKDNVMRSLLATKTYSLAATWSGPYWPVDCHAMAMGETLGYCLHWSQRPHDVGARLAPFVHLSLMGDPTLRMHVVAPPTDAQAAAANGPARLTWKASADKDVLGYHVYRADKAGGTYARLTQTPVKDLAWTDTASAAGATYMIRAIRLQMSPSGSYFNASQGAFASTKAD